MVRNAYKNAPLHLEKIGKRTTVEEIPTLLELSEYHLAEFAELAAIGQHSKATLRQWRSSQRKLKEFISFEFKCSDLLLSEIEFSFAQKLFRYLTIKRLKKLKAAAANKQIKNAKKLLNLAEANGWLLKNPIEKYRCKGDEAEIPPLEMEEVGAIWKKKIDILRLDKVRDAFVFQCFTGFAYQDIYALTPQHIKKHGVERERWLVNKERGKTKVTEMVPVLPIVDEIIDKYKDDPYCRFKNSLLPVNSNAKYNTYLKELADICGIGRELNTHLACHTFADIMLNVLEFPLEDVSKMLGHKSIRTTQRYARVKKRRIGNRMNAVKGLLFQADGQLKDF
ncbi:site-specific integrase [Pedobacter sp. Leaf250]|uniref:site-specific integrase n=1 Tax=Pedobacter sp. Leaf250 TaxID=2876559 RepID=UPI001E36DB3C|nr:site-specific integrase [Pedobacter sp. Leaf250]